jgi:hypothetical protein
VGAIDEKAEVDKKLRLGWTVKVARIILLDLNMNMTVEYVYAIREGSLLVPVQPTRLVSSWQIVFVALVSNPLAA